MTFLSEENKMNIKNIIREELQAVLKEFKSTTVFDLEVVMEVMGVRFKKQGDGGLVAVVRKVAAEAAEDARDESGAEAEELMRIANLSRKCASLMSEAIVLLASATQEREALEESVLNEDGHTDVASARRQLALAIEDSKQMLDALANLPGEGDLPSWWMKKVALSSAYLNGARDYLLTSGEAMNEES